MNILRKLLFAVILAVPAIVIAAQSVNINTADKETLMSIKGVGEKRAEAIIAWREQYGPFKSVDELSEVQGVGKSIVGDNRESLTVGDTK